MRSNADRLQHHFYAPDGLLAAAKAKARLEAGKPVSGSRLIRDLLTEYLQRGLIG